jgi:hypothetical protein
MTLFKKYNVRPHLPTPTSIYRCYGRCLVMQCVGCLKNALNRGPRHELQRERFAYVNLQTFAPISQELSLSDTCLSSNEEGSLPVGC